MKLVLFNLKTMVRSHKAPLLLNIIGLSIAFASFVVIMMQAMYDLRYDRFYSNSDIIYRIEAKMVDNFTPNLPPPLGYGVINNSPDIEMGGWYYPLESYAFYTEKGGKDKALNSMNVRVDSTLFKMFDFKVVSGDLSKVDHLQQIAISERTALKYFGIADVAGMELYCEGAPVTVAAVFKDPPKNTFLKNVEIIRLNQPNSPALQNYNNWNYPFYVMLRDGADLKKVTADVIEQFREKKIMGDREITDDFIRLTPIGDVHFDNNIKYDSVEKASLVTVITLIAMAIIILLIASINFVNFATSLVPKRIRSVNTQKVLGSTDSSLRVSLMVEAMLISLISFGVSLLIVQFAGTTTFPSLISASIAISDNVGLIVVLGLVALGTGVVAGIYPAYYTTSFSPALVLKGSFGLSLEGRKLRTLLIGFQFVISFVFVVAAIFIRVQNDFMKQHDMGFNRDNVYNVFVPDDVAANPSAFRDKLMENPSVKGLTFGSGPIVSNGKMGWGRKHKDGDIQFDCLPVTTEFLDVMEMKIVDGRNFVESDSMRTDGVFIFNETAVKTFGIKVGDRIEGHNYDEQAEVVGVVKDFNFQPMQYAIQPLCLYIMGRDPWEYPNFAYIRADGDIAAVKAHVEKSLRAVAPNEKELSVTMLDSGMEYLYKKENNLALLVTVFSIIAILISIIGVFGIVMFDSRYRRREIAIRKIHGSTVSQILMMFVRYYVRIVIICFVVAVPIAYFIVNNWLENFAYRSEIHWWIFAISLIIITLITIATVVIESLKAATENPVKSIKGE